MWFLPFIYLGVLWASWICFSLFDINLRKFSVIIVSSISSVLLLFLLFLIFPFCTCFTFGYSSVVPPAQYLFSLLFSFQGFSWHILYFQDSFLNHFQSINKLFEGILHFSYNIFCCCCSLLGFLSLLTLAIYTCILSTWTFKALSILIIVVLNSSLTSLTSLPCLLLSLFCLFKAFLCFVIFFLILRHDVLDKSM